MNKKNASEFATEFEGNSSTAVAPLQVGVWHQPRVATANSAICPGPYTENM